MKKLFTLFLLVVISTFTLAQPTAPDPANAAVGVGVIHDFSWTWGSTANRIQFSTSSNMASPTVYTINPAANAFTNTTPLLNGVTYYWQVSADAGANYFPAVPFSFTTVPPAVPYLSSPANLTVVSSELLTFWWSTGVPGLKYTLEISSTADMGTVVSTNNTYDSYVTLNTSIFDTGTDYWWRVTAKTDGNVIINYSNVWKFSMAGLPTPVASYPTGGVSIYNNPPSLYWYQLAYNSKVTSYNVRYSKISTSYTVGLGTTNADEGYFNTASTNWFTTIPFALTPGATYYWQVIPVSGATQGLTWSAEQSFVVYGTQTFLVCYPIYPLLGATVQAEPTFYWTTNTFAPVMYFTLEINDNPSFSDANEITIQNIAASSYTLTPAEASVLTQNGTYYWRVSGGFAPWPARGPVSTIGSFIYPNVVNTVAKAPVPTISGPTSGSVIFVTNPTLTWSASYTEPIQYQVLYSTSPALAAGKLFNPVMDDDVAPWLNTTSFVLTGLTPGATYYWQVRARITTVGAGSESVWSTLGYFTLSPGAASVVPLAGSPINGYPINNTSATISWIIPAPSTSKLTYELEYSTDKNFGSSQKITDLTSTSVTLQGLEKNKDYFWRVASKTEKGEVSSFSAPTAFSTGSVVSVEETVIPNTFELMQNYPNPFNPSTQIKFSIPSNGFVTLKIYDLLGKEIKTLINSEFSAGSHSMQWNGDDNLGNKVSTGIYVYRMTSGNFASSKKMLIIK